jgi:hypothetical protein
MNNRDVSRHGAMHEWSNEEIIAGWFSQACSLNCKIFGAELSSCMQKGFLGLRLRLGLGLRRPTESSCRTLAPPVAERHRPKHAGITVRDRDTFPKMIFNFDSRKS